MKDRTRHPPGRGAGQAGSRSLRAAFAGTGSDCLEADVVALFAQAARDAAEPGRLARRFHRGLARGLARWARAAARRFRRARRGAWRRRVQQPHPACGTSRRTAPPRPSSAAALRHARRRRFHFSRAGALGRLVPRRVRRSDAKRADSCEARPSLVPMRVFISSRLSRRRDSRARHGCDREAFWRRCVPSVAARGHVVEVVVLFRMDGRFKRGHAGRSRWAPAEGPDSDRCCSGCWRCRAGCAAAGRRKSRPRP